MLNEIKRMPDFARIITDDASTRMDKKADGFSYSDVRLTIDPLFRITVTADTTAVKMISLRYNGSWPAGTRFMGDTLERSYGALAWRGLEADNNIICWYFLASCGSHTDGYGVKVRPDAIVYWTVDGEGLTLWLDMRNGGCGTIFNNRVITAAELVTAESNDGKAFALQQRLASLMCTDPFLPARPVYGSNNWCYAYGNSSAKQILVDASIVREAADGLKNRPFIVIDDGWQELARTGKGAQGRPYERGNSLFPDMAGLAADMKAMDVRPGIWMRPLRTGERYINKSLLLDRDKEFLDPSLPETLELVADDISRISGWGYELIKYDFIERDVLGDYFRTLRLNEWHFKNRNITNAEIMKNISRVIYQNARGAELIGCNVAGHLAAGYISIHRSGDDTSGHSYSRSVKMGINCLAFRLAQNDRLFKIDADCVCITPYVPLDKTFDILQLYSLISAPLFVSVQPDMLPGNSTIMEKLKTAFAAASVQCSHAEPLDWFDNSLPEKYLIDGKIYEYKWACEDGWENLYMS